MRLVPEISEATNTATHNTIIQLQASQARFLALMETCRIPGGIKTNEPLGYDTLKDMRLPTQLAGKLDQKLFHAISPMANKEGYLVRYSMQYRINARAVLDQIAQCTLERTAPLNLANP